MTCPTCQVATRVVDSRRIPEGVARRRKCPRCQSAFYTAETAVDKWLHKDTRRGRYRKSKEPENWIDRIRNIFQPNP